MAFYETNRSGPSFLKTAVGRNTDFRFPLHFHTSFELLYVQEGEIEVVVDKGVYHPRAGALVLIPPNSAHSYDTREHSVTNILIFTTGYLPEIYEETQSGVYRDPVITNGATLFSCLKEAEGDLFLLRAALYRIAAAYAKNQPLAAPAERGDDFAFIFSEYMEQHCTEPLSEKSVAKAMGYHPRYLSTLIAKSFGASFCRVLNEYRVREACRLLSGERSITEVYLAVGFESQSTFNRNFKAIMGVTPMQYKQGYLIGRRNHVDGK
ncbi:MAG: helix-turn-helix domain-containing protein [Clostridia bacterium]|nr:helix-turn-helix domain-containing protein [Clostridia bacterium]